jgi:hypothetical protein
MAEHETMQTGAIKVLSDDVSSIVDAASSSLRSGWVIDGEEGPVAQDESVP